MQIRSWQYRAVVQRAVKSSTIFRGARRRLRHLWAVGVGGLMLSTPSLAQQQSKGPSLLFGGAITPSKSPVRLDPVLPRGERLPVPWPVIEGQRSCSSRRPVCVVSSAATTSAIGSESLGEASPPLGAAQSLEYFERAWEEHTFGASLPGPRASFEQPLTWNPDPTRPLTVRRERVPSRGFDRARSRCEGGAPTLENARICLIQSALFASAPATASWLARGLAAQATAQMGDAPKVRFELQSSFAHPQLGILSSTTAHRSWRSAAARRVPVTSLRSARFFEYLEARSQAALGEAAWLSLSLAATRTRPGVTRWEAEPDILDVLAATVRGDGVALARLFDDFAQQSLFQAQAWGTKMEFAWRLGSESLPRNVALADPMEPTGTSYVRVDLQPGDRNKVIAFRMSCESPVSYVWSVVRLDEADSLHSSVEIAYRERGGEAEARITPQPGVRALVLVGTNMGGIDLAHPFDPDHEPHEAHGCQVYVSPIAY